MAHGQFRDFVIGQGAAGYSRKGAWRSVIVPRVKDEEQRFGPAAFGLAVIREDRERSPARLGVPRKRVASGDFGGYGGDDSG